MEHKYIELINWGKAQPRMSGDNNIWLKLYTSILDNEQVTKLDSDSYRLLTNLWALAARLGTNILPADVNWIKRRIPYLVEHNLKVNLKPLLEITDMYGRPAPFIRYCDAPSAEQLKEEPAKPPNPGDQQPAAAEQKDVLCDRCVAYAAASEYISARALSDKFKITWARANKIVKSMQIQGLVGEFIPGKGFVVKARAQSEESRAEKNSPNGLYGEKKEENNPNGLEESPQSRAQRQKQALMQGIAQKQAQKPVEPVNPKESETGAVTTHHVPKQPQSAYRAYKAQPERIGQIISGVFPGHWSDPDCESFGWEIVEALGMSTDRSNQHSRSEWGTFARWLLQLKSVVNVIVSDEIRVIAIKKAKFLSSPKGKSARNKGAVWLTIMAGELRSRGIKLPDIRASPGRVTNVK